MKPLHFICRAPAAGPSYSRKRTHTHTHTPLLRSISLVDVCNLRKNGQQPSESSPSFCCRNVIHQTEEGPSAVVIRNLWMIRIIGSEMMMMMTIVAECNWWSSKVNHTKGMTKNQTLKKGMMLWTIPKEFGIGFGGPCFVSKFTGYRAKKPGRKVKRTVKFIQRNWVDD